MAKSKATGRKSAEVWITSKHKYELGGKTPTGCRIDRLFIERSNDASHQKMLDITCLDGGSRTIRLQDAHQVSLSGGEKRASAKVSTKKTAKAKVARPVVKKRKKVGEVKKGSGQKKRGGFAPVGRAERGGLY